MSPAELPGALAWRRARFQALAETPGGQGTVHLEEVSGIVGGPFGIHQSRGFFTLVHVPTGCELVILTQQKRCKSLAHEIATLRVNWNTSDPYAVTGPDFDRLKAAIARARRAAFPEPPRTPWPP